MKKRYRILTASTTTQLADRVNDALADGAYLIGGPVLDPHGTISQAVLLRENPHKQAPTGKDYLTNDAIGHHVVETEVRPRPFVDPENTLA